MTRQGMTTQELEEYTKRANAIQDECFGKYRISREEYSRQMKALVQEMKERGELWTAKR